VAALTPEAMRDYFLARYSADNILVSAAGNVDFAMLVNTLEEQTQNWAVSGSKRTVLPASPHSGFERLHRPQSSQEYILQLSESPSANDPERYAARLLGSIMGDDSGSRLFWDLVDPGLLEYAGVATYEYEGSGLAMTLLCCEGGTGMENLARLETAQKKLSEEGVTEDELERAKRKVISGLVLQSERPESRMFSVGSGWLIHGDY
ncbi:MAG: insulinase family protein, partial [Planctomycetota bacterium]|nr:insulinase family protein [Planctomycetota bacterium]